MRKRNLHLHLHLHLKRFVYGSTSSNHLISSATNSSRRRNLASAPFVGDEAETVASPREGPGISIGLNWALAGRGVIVKDKAFLNLKPSELQQKGATGAESLSGLPVHVRGNVLGGSSEISKAQFSKLLKQVTAHISSISIIFVHDGAIGSSPKCDAKVRIISDSPSAVLSLSSVLWRTPTRAVSHDSCPLTIYVATSISPSAGDVLGHGAQWNNDFIAADVERSSLILCGKAFTDAKGTKEALATLSGPIITSRGGLPLSAGLLVSGESVILLFASEDTIQSCSDVLVSGDRGVVLSSEGASPLFQSGNCVGSYLSKLPAAVTFVSSDSSGTIPSASKLSPGQAAYHFLAGYQNGKFMPAYSLCPSAVDLLELAKVFLSKIKDNQIPSFLINISEGEKQISGKDLVKFVQSTLLSKNIPPFEPKGGDLHRKYKSFLSTKFQQLPEEFSF
ncbi:hypothetical protein ACSBR2_008729 [Camellia fascicularis]